MKKFLLSIAAVLAIACIAVGLRAVNATPDNTDLTNVTVTAYQGSSPIISMSGADCASVFYVLPGNVKERIITEWDNFNSARRTQGTYAGVKYSFSKGITLEYNGCKIVATNATPEMISRVLHSAQ